MQRKAAACVVTVILLVFSLHAAGGIPATYVTGSAGMKDGTTGTVDLSRPTSIDFRGGSAPLSIPYTGIRFYRYQEENRFRLGVLPAIAVGMLKARSKRHTVTIEWKSSEGIDEVTTLELSRDDAQGLIALLRARCLQACEARSGSPCPPRH